MIKPGRAKCIGIDTNACLKSKSKCQSQIHNSIDHSFSSIRTFISSTLNGCVTSSLTWWPSEKSIPLREMGSWIRRRWINSLPQKITFSSVRRWWVDNVPFVVCWFCSIYFNTELPRLAEIVHIFISLFQRVHSYILDLLGKFEVALTWDGDHLLIPSMLPPERYLRKGNRDTDIRVPLKVRLPTHHGYQRLWSGTTNNLGSDHSLICLQRTARFARALRCCSFVRSLIPELVGMMSSSDLVSSHGAALQWNILTSFSLAEYLDSFEEEVQRCDSRESILLLRRWYHLSHQRSRMLFSFDPWQRAI